ncbi:MAG TPA: transglutaminase domain-containing protein, partial [Candidatus Nanoarchaeia archaeon]|nr:transglutaminase domain-containing protein [Candidatus Nanoarchaeia archaeon]
FTYSADNQFIRVFNSPILKGEVLEANLTLVNTSNGFRESFSNFTRSGFFTVGVNPELMPFKLLSVEPANDSLVIAGKPVIKLFFNKPLNTSQSFGFLGSGVTSFEDGNKTLIFFPLEPLSSGVKRVNLSGITDLHGLKLLDNTSSVFRFLSTYSSGLKYSLSNPLVFNASRSFYFRNNNSNAVRLSIDMALIDSKLPSMYSVINGYSLEPSGFNVDSFGNHRAYWNLNLNPGERVDLVINYTFLLLSVNYFDFINVSAIGNSVASDYSVLSWAGLQVSDELISSLSNRLSSKDDSDFIKALRVYDWVRGNINYDYSGTYPNDAISVLVNRTGVCEGYSNIYTALTRSLGLPTRFIFGYTLSGTDGSDSSGHTWAEVYVSNIGWLPVDPTWGRSVNDWFLNTDSSHALALTMPGWPVSGTDWFNYDTGSAYDYSSYVFNYTLVNSDSLWSTEVNDVYNAVRALDFKKRVLNFPFYDGLLVDGSHYVFTRKYYDSDLSALGTDYLLVQSGNYSTVTASVYSELIGLFSSLLDDYYTELSSAYSNCSSCVNFTSYIDASSGKSLGFLFSSVNNSLANSTVLLNAGDFDSLINELGSVMVSLERGINWNRVYLLNDYLFSDYRLANDLVVSDLFISNYVANEASVSNDLSPVELFYSVVIVLLMFVFAPVSWFICLIRGGKSHGRVFWLLVIFFFNFIGAIWYWVKEH